MIGGSNLRKGLRLRRVGLMAAYAEHGCVQFFRRHGSRIVRVLGQRSVARFAIYVRVLAILLFFEDVGVAAFASLVPRVIDRPGCDFGQRVAPIVPILSETFWDQKPPEDQEQEDARDEDSRQSKKMSRVFEGIPGHIVGKESLHPSVLCLSRQEETGVSRDTGARSKRLCPASPHTCAQVTWGSDARTSKPRKNVSAQTFAPNQTVLLGAATS